MSVIERKAGSAQADRSCILPRHAIILNCFGRGGSNIVWNMIGSSPDVIMPNSEWHDAVFGKWNRLRKLMRGAGARFDWNLVPGLARLAADRQRRGTALWEFRSKPEANAITIKVMGHHIVFANLIEAGFATHRHLILTRHPLPMCESLIRVGNAEADVIALYNDIATTMLDIARRDRTLLLKFEDVIADPAGFCRKLHADLGIATPADGLIRVKIKKFGEERQDRSATGAYTAIPFDALRDQIDATVNRKAVERLDAATRERIWTATREAARPFGYDELQF
ncbi:MAG: hypothetical protein RH982_16655 [Parvibaculum sp.]